MTQSEIFCSLSFYETCEDDDDDDVGVRNVVVP